MNPDVFRNISYGLYVLTAKNVQKDKPTGCIINSAFQVTSNPAQFAISVNHDNYTNKCIKETGYFALSIISENVNPAIISSFGFRSGKDNDKFEGVAYKIVNDLAVLDDSCGYLICKVVNTMETETHTIFLASVLDGDVVKNEQPMTYAYYHRVIKGKAPKNAPTYIGEGKEDKKDNKPVYKCTICGYIYDGEIPFEDLPDDYVCPICGAPKSDFEKV